MAKRSKLDALISLLDDPDQFVFDQIKGEILLFGNEIVPILEEKWEKAFDQKIQSRVENLIHRIQISEVGSQLMQWKLNDGSYLDASIIIAKYQYPDLDEERVRSFVDQLTQDIWIEMNPNYTALEKAGIINKIFFSIYGFRGNKNDYYHPKNAYINQVLDCRRGSPISLAILYLEIAQRLKIPVYGVNLPEHFVLAYTDLPLPFGDRNDPENILFYINLFNQGSFFQLEDIEEFLEQLKLEVKAEYYLPCTKLDVVNRLINNLIYSYSQNKEEEKVNDLLDIRKNLK